MLSITALTASAQAVADYAEGDESAARKGRGPEDYYAEGGTAPSQFIGRGAAALGLDEYDREWLAGVLSGQDPRTGDQLAGGGGNGKRRPGWDLTFSADKSVSAVWAAADANTSHAIQSAHDRGVERAMQHVEDRLAKARRGKGGGEQEGVDAIVASRHTHGSSRAQEPALHDHVILANLARREDGTWGALETKEVYRAKLAAGAIYRAEVAKELERQGFQIERNGDSMRIAGVPQDLCDHWSSRRQQVEQSMAEHGTSSAKAAEAAALATRTDKPEVSREELEAKWEGEAAEYGLDHAQIERLQDPGVRPSEQDLGEMPTDDELLERITAHDALFNEHEVWRVVAVDAQGRGQGLDEIAERVEKLMQSREVVRLQDPRTGAEVGYTTRELMRMEREAIQSAEARAGETAHRVAPEVVDAAVDQHQAEAGFRLSPEQEAAVRHVASDSGGIAAIVGDAGSGKSASMHAARLALEAEGYRVRGAALSGKAAGGLQDGSGIESSTIHSLVMSLEPGEDGSRPRDELTAQDVIVVDEAAMVDSRLWYRLQSHADAVGAKIVAVGDAKQLQAVGAGGVFRHLTDRLGAAEITEIRRQQDTGHAQAVRGFAHGEAAEALRWYLQRDAVHVADEHDSAVEQAVDSWWAGYDRQEPSAVVMMANTNADVAALNRAARARMAEAHQLGPAATITTRDREDRSTGQMELAEGDRVRFRLNDRETGVKNGELATVERLAYDRDGQLTVTAVKDGGERVKFSPEDYASLSHGYAVTTHAAQGVTADRAVVLAGGGMQSRESTYVQMSRARYETELVMTRSAVEELGDQVEPTEAMAKYAEDLAERQGAELPEGYATDFWACRDFLTRHDPREDLESTEVPAELRDVQAVVQAMSRSRQKATTLDYKAESEVETAPAADSPAATTAPVPESSDAEESGPEPEPEPEPAQAADRPGPKPAPAPSGPGPQPQQEEPMEEQPQQRTAAELARVAEQVRLRASLDLQKNGGEPRRHSLEGANENRIQQMATDQLAEQRFGESLTERRSRAEAAYNRLIDAPDRDRTESWYRERYGGVGGVAERIGAPRRWLRDRGTRRERLGAAGAAEQEYREAASAEREIRDWVRSDEARDEISEREHALLAERDHYQNRYGEWRETRDTRDAAKEARDRLQARDPDQAVAVAPGEGWADVVERLRAEDQTPAQEEDQEDPSEAPAEQEAAQQRRPSGPALG